MSTQSSITQQQLSPDVLESPIYQNFELVELTVFCRRLAGYVDDRRFRTFHEFAALTGYPVLQIEEAWDLRCSSAEDITYTITKMGWETIEEARWRAEMSWRLGHTNNRPHLLYLMPRRQVVINDTLSQLTVARPTSTSPPSASTSSSSTSTPISSSSHSGITNSRDQEVLPERTRKPSTS
ncbi:hypothetical protein QM012_009404 [Aureobasidium pullulans]|uniref:CSN8/PSMD8/EIF3K domain-containing protein n=1 Tax=Aureobasidium pullulans TaxID=5580 RepID=A0ABR0TGR3_AURPU